MSATAGNSLPGNHHGLRLPANHQNRRRISPRQSPSRLTRNHNLTLLAARSLSFQHDCQIKRLRPARTFDAVSIIYKPFCKGLLFFRAASNAVYATEVIRIEMMKMCNQDTEWHGMNKVFCKLIAENIHSLFAAAES